MTVVKIRGRIVWGNPQKARPKTDQNNQPVFKDGKQVEQWSFGLAVPAADFAATVWPVMAAEAQKVAGGAVPSNFAYKFKDGTNGLDQNNKPLRDREGYNGHYVLSISQEAFAPNCFRYENGGYVQINDGIKTGDYVEVSTDIVGHGVKPNTRGANPGLYLNPQGILFLGYGAAIVTGPDANEMFGGAAPALPPGASAVPVGPPAGAPQMPGTSVPGFPMAPGNVPQMMPGAPAAPPMPPTFQPLTAPAVAQPAMPPVAPPQPIPTAFPSNPPFAAPAPAHDFVTNATGFVMPGAPTMPGAPPMAAPVPMAPPAPAMAPPAPAQPVHVGYDPASGKPIWQMPDGSRVLGQ